MSTASEEILNRYKKKETVADKFGRLVTVRRLRMHEQMRIVEFSDSEKENVARIMFTIGSVVEVDGQIYPFPKSRAELDANMSLLDEEGLAAASEALRRLQALDGDVGADSDAAKN